MPFYWPARPRCRCVRVLRHAHRPVRANATSALDVHHDSWIYVVLARLHRCRSRACRAMPGLASWPLALASCVCIGAGARAPHVPLSIIVLTYCMELVVARTRHPVAVPSANLFISDLLTRRTSLTDNTTSPAKVSIKSQCYGTSIIHLTHTNVGTRKAARQRGGGWRRRSQLPGRNRSQRPRANFFKRRHAGETGSERSSFRDNNRSCTPAQSKNMGG